ncbi:MAG: MarR family transcriptional regulator [Prolixibacteraceae bacterium]|nr:MarR family transcriptional regulator [Prolixibacteraceae bacterium]
MNEQQSIGRLISIINRLFSVYFNSKMKDKPIGFSQVHLLKYIEQNEGCSQRQVNEYFMSDKGTTTTLLNSLEQNKLIVRMRNKEDSRIKNLSVTEKGKVFMGEMKVVLGDWTAILLKGFDENERDMAFKVLNKMVANVSYLKEYKERN